MVDSATIGDFLAKRLTIDDDGRLLYDNDVDDAFGLVTGFLPAGLRIALQTGGYDDDEAARGFVFWLRRSCAKTMWRPTFNAAKAAAARGNELASLANVEKTCPDISDVSDDDTDGDPDDTGYASDEYLDSAIAHDDDDATL